MTRLIRHGAGRLAGGVTVVAALAAACGMAVTAVPAAAQASSPGRARPAAVGRPAAAGRPAGLARTAHGLRLGSVAVHKCAKHGRALCGGIKAPLDYSSAASPRIHIGFRWIPASGPGRAAGTILAVEGGPGYSSTGSESLYVAMAGPLLRTRNLLLVNLRGTGNSTPVKCTALEHAGPHQYGPRFNRLVAACGAQLNHTWHYRGGGWVHASDLFNTAYSARDVARVLTALRTGRADLYGDSYGSWFAQVFASRYPGLLRSVTLDSTYQVLGLDPWYTTTVVTARRAFDQACARWAACRAAARGPAWRRISALTARLARSPVTGMSTTDNGVPGRVTVTVETLVNLVNNAGFDPVVYRDLDAAGRALLRDRDPAPLLRLAALSVGYDDTNEPLDGYSDGLYFAVACTDYVQLFSRDAPPAVRARQYAAALRREPRRTFAPFSVTQWTNLDQYTEAYSACLDWPAPVHHIAPITQRPPLVPARLPVLILSGTLDSLTPKLDGATLVARQLGRSARLVTVANLTHVTAQDGDNVVRAVGVPAVHREPRSARHGEHLLRAQGRSGAYGRELPGTAAWADSRAGRAGQQGWPHRAARGDRGPGQRGRRDQPGGRCSAGTWTAACAAAGCGTRAGPCCASGWPARAGSPTRRPPARRGGTRPPGG